MKYFYDNFLVPVCVCQCPLWGEATEFWLKVSLKNILIHLAYSLRVMTVHFGEAATEVRPDGWTHYKFFLRGDERKIL